MAQRLNSPDGEGVTHFVTLNIRERKPAFRRPEYAQLVLRELRFECDKHPAKLLAYVAMPDHLHFLLWPEDGKLSRFLARFKPGVTLRIDALAKAHRRDKEREWLAAKGPRELWQDSKYSLSVFSRQWIEEKINYIHQNSVRAGLVENAEDYAYSSIGAYLPVPKVTPVRVDLIEF